MSKLQSQENVFLVELLSQCQCKKGGGGSFGRVQWDPARDILTSENNGKEPRKILSKRAIQIGLKEKLSDFYHMSKAFFPLKMLQNLLMKLGKLMLSKIWTWNH